MMVTVPGSEGFLVVPRAATAGSQPVSMQRKSSSSSYGSKRVWPTGAHSSTATAVPTYSGGAAVIRVLVTSSIVAAGSDLS